MSQAAAIAAIRSRFISQVATPQGLVVVYDNAPAVASTVPTARVTVQVREERLLTLGRPRRWRAVGEVEVRLSQPRERGDADILSKAEAVLDAFRGVTIASPVVRFTPPPTVVGALDAEDALASRTVRVPFEADYSTT